MALQLSPATPKGAFTMCLAYKATQVILLSRPTVGDTVLGGADCATEKHRVTEALLGLVPELKRCLELEVIFMHSWMVADIAKIESR